MPALEGGPATIHPSKMITGEAKSSSGAINHT